MTRKNKLHAQHPKALAHGMGNVAWCGTYGEVAAVSEKVDCLRCKAMQENSDRGREPTRTARYLLKTVGPKGEAHGGFRWPLTPDTVVTAPDWDPTPECGGGLHGALNGEGDGGLFDWSEGAIWIAAEIPEGVEVVDLGGKVKVQSCIVWVAGTREEATSWLSERCPGAAIIGGTSTSGNRGTSTSGDGGTSTSGNDGTSTSGNDGTSTSGDYGTSTSGNGGTSTSGDGGMLAIKRWDGSRHRLHVAYVGENGIEPNVPYRLDEDGKFVRAEDEE